MKIVQSIFKEYCAALEEEMSMERLRAHQNCVLLSSKVLEDPRTFVGPKYDCRIVQTLSSRWGKHFLSSIIQFLLNLPSFSLMEGFEKVIKKAIDRKIVANAVLIASRKGRSLAPS